MGDSNANFVRKLNARERRRLDVHRMLPADAIDPKCSTRNIVERHQTKLLYRYGCSLMETKLEIEDNSEKHHKKRSFLFKLRGFWHQYLSSSFDSLFVIINFHSPATIDFLRHHREERTRNRKRRSITSSIGDSLDEPTFIFEPIFMVGVFVRMMVLLWFHSNFLLMRKTFSFHYVTFLSFSPFQTCRNSMMGSFHILYHQILPLKLCWCSTKMTRLRTP